MVCSSFSIEPAPREALASISGQQRRIVRYIMGNSTINARNRSITNAWMLFVCACARDGKGLRYVCDEGLISMGSMRSFLSGVSIEGSFCLHLAATKQIFAAK